MRMVLLQSDSFLESSVVFDPWKWHTLLFSSSCPNSTVLCSTDHWPAKFVFKAQTRSRDRSIPRGRYIISWTPRIVRERTTEHWMYIFCSKEKKGGKVKDKDKRNSIHCIQRRWDGSSKIRPTTRVIAGRALIASWHHQQGFIRAVPGPTHRAEELQIRWKAVNSVFSLLDPRNITVDSVGTQARGYEELKKKKKKSHMWGQLQC